jgi:hypothetical protein
MERKEVIGGILYYAVVLIVWWIMSRDGAPLMATIYFYTFKTCQTTARVIGGVGLKAENCYHKEMELAA